MTAPGVEGLTVSGWINARLSTSAALLALCSGDQNNLDARIWEGVAPSSTPGPWWITWTILPARDIKVVGLIQVMAQVQFQVKVTGEGTSYAPLMAPYRAVHAALETQANQTVAATGGLLLSCGRVESIQYPEETLGVHYRNLGGLYETHAQ